MSNHIEECMEVGGIDKHKFWQSHIEAWKHSGKTQSDFYRDNGLGIKVFGYWSGISVPYRVPRQDIS